MSEADVEVIDSRCLGSTKTNKPCRMQPTGSGYCLNHQPGRDAERHANRSKAGKLARAREALQRAKQDAMVELGIEGELPDLETVESCQAYIASVAARVESRAISPQQANALAGLVRLSKDLIGLSVDVKLAERLAEIEQTGGRRMERFQ